TAPGSIVVLEKPFGEDLAGAIGLNHLLSTRYAAQAIFRGDHLLAMATVHDLLGTRLGKRVFAPIWYRCHISSADIISDESLAPAPEGPARVCPGVGRAQGPAPKPSRPVPVLTAMGTADQSRRPGSARPQGRRSALHSPIEP